MTDDIDAVGDGEDGQAVNKIAPVAVDPVADEGIEAGADFKGFFGVVKGKGDAQGRAYIDAVGVEGPVEEGVAHGVFAGGQGAGFEAQEGGRRGVVSHGLCHAEEDDADGDAGHEQLGIPVFPDGEVLWNDIPFKILDGIANEIEPPDIFTGDVYAAAELPAVPRTLRDGLELFVESSFARDAFGGFDSACIRTGTHGTGTILESTAEDCRIQYEGNFRSVFYALKALLPPLVEQKSGQVVINTSAAGARVQEWFALYGATRAGANELIHAAGLEAAPHGVTVNGTGTYAMNYPSFLHDVGADTDPAKLKAVTDQFEDFVSFHRGTFDVGLGGHVQLSPG